MLRSAHAVRSAVRPDSMFPAMFLKLTPDRRAIFTRPVAPTVLSVAPPNSLLAWRGRHSQLHRLLSRPPEIRTPTHPLDLQFLQYNKCNISVTNPIEGEMKLPAPLQPVHACLTLEIARIALRYKVPFSCTARLHTIRQLRVVPPLPGLVS